MKIIKTAKGQEIKVDDDDFEKLSKYTWHVSRYVQTSEPRENGRQTRPMMHRIILNAQAGQLVDHINHDRLDNQKYNLRICDHQQNAFNSRKAKNKSSKYKGIWRAKIRHNQNYIGLGSHETEEEAAIAYNLKAKELFGEFAYLNKINGT